MGEEEEGEGGIAKRRWRNDEEELCVGGNPCRDGEGTVVLEERRDDDFRESRRKRKVEEAVV